MPLIKSNVLDKLLDKFKCIIRKLDIILLQFMSKLLKCLSKKAQFKRKKLHSCFNRKPCGSGRKYKVCCGK